VTRSVDFVRRVIRFCLALFLWSHALFLLNVQSKILEYLRDRVQVTSAEAILLVLLLTFSFLAGGGFWKTFVNLLYVYFFPFVLLFYLFYWPIRLLRLGFPKVATVRSSDIAAGTLVVQASPASVVLTAPISEHKGETESKLRTVLKLLSRPFRKFTYLWCILLLLATHKPIVGVALTVLLLQLAGKIYWVTRLFWSSKTFLARAATGASQFLNDTINKLTSLNFEIAPAPELKNLLVQVKGFKSALEFITNSTFFTRLAFGIGLLMLVCAHVYFALIFSCVYVGAARIADLKLAWPDSLAISFFILAYVTELPRTLALRLLGGIHFTLFLALGAGTVVSYFRRQLEPLRSTLASVNMRLSEEELQQRIIVLQKKVDAAESATKNAKN
jgi:hypothetical protein